MDELINSFKDKAKTINYIANNAVRHRTNDGTIDYVTFQILFGRYKIPYCYKLYQDGKVERRNSKIDDEYKKVEASPYAGGQYEKYTINGCAITHHILTMLCVDEDFMKNYTGGVVINHMVTHPKRCNKSGYLVKSCVAIDEYGNAVDNLEYVSVRENIRQGRLVTDYGLYNIRVSAKDVDDILTLGLMKLSDVDSSDYDNVMYDNGNKVVAYYKNKGIVERVDYRNLI